MRQLSDKRLENRVELRSTHSYSTGYADATPARQHCKAGEHAVKWVTRKNANVDRVACPWLIKRFVDEQAEFIYVPTDQVMSVVQRDHAIPYDVKYVELGHVDGRCSFESIMVKYGLDDPGLKLLAKIVHGADVEADRGIIAEAAGLYAIAHGFALVHGDDDHEKIRQKLRSTTRCTRGARSRQPAGNEPRLLGRVQLPLHRSDGGFDHGDVD